MNVPINMHSVWLPEIQRMLINWDSSVGQENSFQIHLNKTNKSEAK